MPHINSDITFVDDKDTVIGSGARKKAVDESIIHRVVRVLVFNAAGELLIQKRSSNVSIPGRWDDSAAGHVDAGEEYHTSAVRELREEVGISNVMLEEISKYYSEDIDDAITKKRFTTIYSTIFNGNGAINFDPDEVSEVRWISLDELRNWMESKPEDFTNGFIHCLESYEYTLKTRA